MFKLYDARRSVHTFNIVKYFWQTLNIRLINIIYIYSFSKIKINIIYYDVPIQYHTINDSKIITFVSLKTSITSMIFSPPLWLLFTPVSTLKPFKSQRKVNFQIICLESSIQMSVD